MNTKQLPATCYKSKMYLKRHSATILTWIGATGVIVTTIVAIKATPKAIILLNAATVEKGEKLTKMEYIQTVGPAYIPTALIGISTVTCIFGANFFNIKKQATIISAYSMLDQSYRRYREAAISIFGDDANSKIQTEIAKKVYISADGMAIYDRELDAVSDEILFYDQYSHRYFTSTMASVLNAQYHINRNFALRGIASLNEFYDFIGLPKIDDGDSVGWSMIEFLESGITWIDFENRFVKLDDGLECYIMAMMFDPTTEYLEFYRP